MSHMGQEGDPTCEHVINYILNWCKPGNGGTDGGVGTATAEEMGGGVH